DDDPAERDARRLVADPQEWPRQCRYRVHYSQYARGDRGVGRAGLLARRDAARVAPRAQGVRAAAVGLLRRAGLYLLPAAHRRVRRRPYRADRDGGDVRHRGDDREYDDWARSGAARHRLHRERHAARPDPPAAADAAAGGSAAPCHRHQASGCLFGHRNCCRRIHSGDGGHRQADRVRVSGFRQQNDVRHAVAVAAAGDGGQRCAVAVGEASASPLRPAMKPQHYDAVLLVAGFLVCWQLLYVLVGPDVVSAPIGTLMRAAALLRTEDFWHDAASTGAAFAYACAIGIAGGLIFGLVVGLSRFAAEVADPILSTVYSIPKITLYPIILLIFGLSPAAQIAFGVIHG